MAVPSIETSSTEWNIPPPDKRGMCHGLQKLSLKSTSHILPLAVIW